VIKNPRVKVSVNQELLLSTKVNINRPSACHYSGSVHTVGTGVKATEAIVGSHM
jgi:hypothetical protein